jgi:hypothetical protein
MRPRTAAGVARIAGRCTVVLFVASLISCAFGGAGRGGSLSAVLVGFLLFVLALAGVIVWVTARDVAGDEPPTRRQ